MKGPVATYDVRDYLTAEEFARFRVVVSRPDRKHAGSEFDRCPNGHKLRGGRRHVCDTCKKQERLGTGAWRLTGRSGAVWRSDRNRYAR